MGARNSKNNADKNSNSPPVDKPESQNGTGSTSQNNQTYQDQNIDAERKLKEQNNLLRYKIEVLVNMLALEEKKYEAQTSRLESLKLIMLSQGITESSFKAIVSNSSSTDIKSSKYSRKNFELFAQNMRTALAKMHNEFKTCREDILHAFADDDGKIAPALSRDDFLRQLYHSTTEGLDKSDVQMISLRFLIEDNQVSVPEFLEFLSTPTSIRQARAATSAVRMSLAFLQLDEVQLKRDYDNNADNEISEEEDKEFGDIGEVTLLESAIEKLLVKWDEVKDFIELSFTSYANSNKSKNNGKLIPINTFKTIMLSTNPIVLTESDIEIIANKFEICDSIHWGHFIKFFSEKKLTSGLRRQGQGHNRQSQGQKNKLHSSLTSELTPQNISSEWKTLKNSTMISRNSVNKNKNNKNNNKLTKEGIAEHKNIEIIHDDNQTTPSENKIIKTPSRFKAAGMVVGLTNIANRNTGKGTEESVAIITTVTATADKSVSEMSLAELESHVLSLGISEQARGFTEKSEYIALLDRHGTDSKIELNTSVLSTSSTPNGRKGSGSVISALGKFMTAKKNASSEDMHAHDNASPVPLAGTQAHALATSGIDNRHESNHKIERERRDSFDSAVNKRSKDIIQRNTTVENTVLDPAPDLTNNADAKSEAAVDLNRKTFLNRVMKGVSKSIGKLSRSSTPTTRRGADPPQEQQTEIDAHIKPADHAAAAEAKGVEGPNIDHADSKTKKSEVSSLHRSMSLPNNAEHDFKKGPLEHLRATVDADVDGIIESSESINDLRHRFKEAVEKKIGTSRSGESSMKTLFRSMDINGDKKITEKEMLKAVTMYKIGFTAEEVQMLFGHIDKDKSGSIDFAEFSEAMNSSTSSVSRVLFKAPKTPQRKSITSQSPPAPVASVDDLVANLRQQLVSELGSLQSGVEQLADVFTSMDENNDGSLSERELKKALRGLNVKFSPEDIHGIFGYFDTDTSGSINYQEFLNFIESTSSQNILHK